MPTVIIGNNTGDDYSGTEDAQIKEIVPTNNYGIGTSFEVTKYGSGDHTNALIGFSGLSNLPEGSTINSAIIYLRVTAHNAGDDRTITAKKLLRSWIKGTQFGDNRSNDTPYSCCWNEYGEGNAWSDPGGLSDGNDRASAISGTVSISGSGLVSITGAQLATDIEAGAQDWHLERTGGQDDSLYTVFASSENSTDGYRPYLYVEYTESGGATANGYYYTMNQ